MTNGDKEPHKQSPIVLYTAPDGKVTVDVYFANDNFWLTQKTMAELFDVTVASVFRHLKNIYASGELGKEATISKNEIVQNEGGHGFNNEVQHLEVNQYSRCYGNKLQTALLPRA